MKSFMKKDDTQNDQKETGSDLQVPFFFLGWAGVGWASLVTSWHLFSDHDGGLDPGPALLPIITLVVLTIGSLGLAIKPILKIISAGFLFKLKIEPNWLPIFFFVSVVVFPMAMSIIGYIAATFVFVFAWGVLFNPQVSKRPYHIFVVAFVAAIITTSIIYVGFDLVIGARLPK